MFALINELWRFLKFRKKLWLAPVIGVVFIIGFLLVTAEGSVLAPFVYTIF